MRWAHHYYCLAYQLKSHVRGCGTFPKCIFSVLWTYWLSCGNCYRRINLHYSCLHYTHNWKCRVCYKQKMIRNNKWNRCRWHHTYDLYNFMCMSTTSFFTWVQHKPRQPRCQISWTIVLCLGRCPGFLYKGCSLPVWVHSLTCIWLVPSLWQNEAHRSARWCVVRNRLHRCCRQ